MLSNARKFIKKYRLTESRLSFGSLKRIFVSMGYKVVFFNKYHNPATIQSLINTYELWEYATSRKSFVFVDNFIKLLFLHEHTDEDVLIHFMLHELGHIWLRHNPNAYREDLQEKEADEFAIAVKLLLKKQTKVRAFIILCTALITAFTVFLSLSPVRRTPASEIPSIPRTTVYAPDTSSDMVCITKSGKKYHRADCMYVEHKDNVIEITIDEAVKAGYEPCKVCKP